MSFSPLIEQLIEAFRCLPGVGPKTAQRMAFHLLHQNRDKGNHLAQAIQTAMKDIGRCHCCHNFSETDICQLCQNPKRDTTSLCIVESPADVLAIEQTSIYRGHYFVLMGHLSPIDGIGPQELGLHKLRERLTHETITEIILATNHTVEGEATAYYITEMAKPLNIKISRIARGIPSGGELEYIDSRTLTDALNSRQTVSD